jgi:hypothetical protein
MGHGAWRAARLAARQVDQLNDVPPDEAVDALGRMYRPRVLLIVASVRLPGTLPGVR